MICESIKPRLRDYLDDLVPEPERVPIRSHLSECQNCRDYSFAFGNFNSDLRKLAMLAPSPSSREQVMREMARVPRLAPLAIPKFSPWPAAIILSVFFIGAGVWHQIHSWRPQAPRAAIPEIQPAEEPQSLTPLQTEINPEDLKAKYANPLTSSKYDIAIRPFHWDVEFSDLEARSAFIAKLRDRYGAVKPHFEAPFFVVFSAPRDTLKEILTLMTELGAGIRGGKMMPSFIPEYSGDVRISLSLGVPQSKISKTLLHHWHLKFELPNKFTFKERMREAGAQFLYESPETWVVEIQGKDFGRIQDLINDTNGLNADTNGEHFLSTESYKSIPVRVSLYIDEG